MYDPASPPDEIAAGVAAAFAQRVLEAGVTAASDFEGTRAPRLLPALQLVPVHAETSAGGGPLGQTEWTLTWRVDLYVQMKDYVRAQRELLGLVTRILHLPILERAAGGPILGGSCDDWAVEDDGDDPDPRDPDEILYKRLTLRAVATTVP